MHATLYLTFLIVLLGSVQGVLLGDEQYEVQAQGMLYVFASKAIHVIDPENLIIVKNITSDQDNKPLVAYSVEAVSGMSNNTRTWNDAVYIEDAGNALFLIFINEGDTYYDAQNNAFSYVTVVDTLQQKVVDRVRVGARPVHMYAVSQRKEIWSHSDATGSFFVISVDTPGNLTSVESDYIKVQAHGKLLIDGTLYPVGYATNVGEQYITKYQLDKNTVIAHFAINTTAPGGPTNTTCIGTHSIVYSAENKHVYLECVDGGTLEWDSVTDKIVHFFPNVTGYLSATPGADRILATDSDTSLVTVLSPRGNGVPSDVTYTIVVPGNPAQEPVFYSNNFTTTAMIAEDYLLFFPLYRDTNINNIRAANQLGRDVTDDGYLAAPFDCQYSPEVTSAALSSNTSTAPLVLAQYSNGTTITPACGACAPGVSPEDPSQWNASLSGFRVTSFGAVDAAAQAGLDDVATLLIPAGAKYLAIDQATGVNACSYNPEANRAAVRAGAFIAIVADLPQPSVYFVRALGNNAPTQFGYVATNSSPAKLVWVA